MNIKEKASRYDEVLNRAKITLDCCGSTSIATKNAVYDIFPELRESEDEKVRKELLEHCKNQAEPYIKTGNKCPQIQSWIAWLEKQGEPKLSEDLGEYITELSKQFPEVSFAKLSRIAVRVKNWLEKQGKETSWKPSKEEMDVLYGLAYITNQYDEHKEEVITRLYQDLKREFFNGSSYENMFPTNTSTEDDIRRRSTIQVLEYARSLDAYNQYGKADIDKNIDWLEKQGDKKFFDDLTQQEAMDIAVAKCFEQDEQNPTDKVEPKFKVGDEIKTANEESLTITKIDEKGYWSKDLFICDFDEECLWHLVEQKPNNNVEPKFHEGDWITNGDYTWKIVEVKPLDYILQSQDGNIVDDTISHVDEQFHLWTINDAKDGDVLADDDNNIFIFDGTVEKGKYPFAYCGLTAQGFDSYDIRLPFTHDNNIHPATWEQRNLLFKKMKEAGYEWDSEKKEQKEIDPKPYGQRKECLDCQFNYVGECKGSCAMKRGEQKPNLYFKAKDWYVSKVDGKIYNAKFMEKTSTNQARKLEIEKAAMSATGILKQEEWFIKGAEWSDKNPSYISSEKQDEQKSQRLVSAEAKEALYDKPTDEEMKELLRTEYEKGRADVISEMKSSWSEEDETNSCHLKTLFENLAKDIKHEFRIISDNDRDKYTAWLKSLKQKIGE